LGHAGTSADESGTPMKDIKSKIPTPPTLPKPVARAPTCEDETDGATGTARAEGASRGAVQNELQKKFLERQSRANAAAKRAGGLEADAREPGARRRTAGAEGGLGAAWERVRSNMRPASGGETDGADSTVWDE